jgi:hypothetical protein
MVHDIGITIIAFATLTAVALSIGSVIGWRLY